MSKLDNRNTMPRYSVIIAVMILICIAILAKVVYTMTVKRPYWEEVSHQLTVDSIPDPAQRGNILSCDGQLLASTLPEYRLYMDFKAGGKRKQAMLEQAMDTLCDELHRLFPAETADEFRARLEEGRKKESQHWAIYQQRIDYNTLQEVKKLPLFRLTPGQGGFHVDPNSARKHPFDRLAIRTLGNMFGEDDTPTSGLEYMKDSLLRGESGWRRQMKVRNQMLTISGKEPKRGADIVTTIDVNMQDLSERYLREKLEEVNAIWGVAVVMEVATGDIKAMVNLDRCSDGKTYAERESHAVSDRLEPGSVFKTASLLVALDDGYCDTTKTVFCHHGKRMMYTREMHDANWNTSGGYGMLTMPEVLQKSSNVGVSSIIDEYYHKQPEKFVEGIRRTGIGDSLGLPLPRCPKPIIKDPTKKKYWSATDLPWMSIGYVTGIPPISTLTFYNTIANGGKMMRPRLIKEIRYEDGETVEIAPEVMRNQIAKPEVIKKMQNMLESVVSRGLGKRAGSKLFRVAGKTGTAQIAGENGKGYRSGVMNYLLSFVGYFPADDPKYSCIVCVRKEHNGGGGSVSAPVFHNIAEGIMAQSIKRVADKSKDTEHSPMPEVKRGDLHATDVALSRLGFATNGTWGQQQYARQNRIGTASYAKENFRLQQSATYPAGTMPDVSGMGARDAVYQLERRGLKVTLRGRGKVAEQSISAGSKIKRGQQCTLKLS